MDKDSKPFNTINLNNIIKQMGEEVNIEVKVQDVYLILLTASQFLVDIGNDFIEKILVKSEEISEKKQDNRKSVEPSDIKFVLSKFHIIMFFMTTWYFTQVAFLYFRPKIYFY